MFTDFLPQDTQATATSKSRRDTGFARDIVDMRNKLRHSDIFDSLCGDPIAQHATDGIVTVAALTNQFPLRTMQAVQGFKAAQYLTLGWASPSVLRGKQLHCEPVGDLDPEDVHVVAISESTGAILGYIGLAKPHADTGEEFPRFATEHAHSIVFPLDDNSRRNTTRELKRFVKRRDTDYPEIALRKLVVVEVMLVGLLAASRLGVTTFVGDLEEHVVGPHLKWLGLTPKIIYGTSPSLSTTTLMYPMYIERASVVPFHTDLPSAAECVSFVESMWASRAGGPAHTLKKAS